MSPIKFDQRLNEYQLVFEYQTNDNKYIVTRSLYFCPWTGKRLPPSRRPAAVLKVD